MNELLHYGLDGTKRPVMGMEARAFSPFTHRGRYIMKEPLDQSTLASEIVSWCEAALEEKLPLAKRTQPTPQAAEPGFVSPCLPVMTRFVISALIAGAENRAYHIQGAGYGQPAWSVSKHV